MPSLVLLRRWLAIMMALAKTQNRFVPHGACTKCRERALLHVQVFRDVLCSISCSGTSANAFAQSFLQQNVTLSSARLLSITPDGAPVILQEKCCSPCHLTWMLVFRLTYHTNIIQRAL